MAAGLGLLIAGKPILPGNKGSKPIPAASGVGEERKGGKLVWQPMALQQGCCGHHRVHSAATFPAQEGGEGGRGG